MGDKISSKLTDKLKKNKDEFLKLLRYDTDIRNEIKEIFIEAINQKDLFISSDIEDININDERQNENSGFLLNRSENNKNGNIKLKDEIAQRERQILSLQRELEDKKAENLRLKDEVKYKEKEISECSRLFGEERTEYENEVVNLRNKIERLENRCDELKEENEKLAGDYNKIAGKYKHEKNELEDFKKCVNEFKNNYGVLDEKYQLYLQLGDDIHRKLQRVLSPNGRIAENAEIFLGYGVQEDNIAVLWDVIAAGYHDLENAGKLNDMIEIFNYLFGIHKTISFKKITYTMPEIGEEFDERKHSRASGSDATGEIVKVILPGFKIGNNIQKKALVYVK